MKRILSLLFFFLIVIFPAYAVAIQYDFSSSKVMGEDINVFFTLTTSDYITTDMPSIIPGLNLTCNNCSELDIYIDAVAHGYTNQQSSVINVHGINVPGYQTNNYAFYFELGSFAASGTYNSILLQNINEATLTVSGSTSAVPEPSTMLLLGFGLIGLCGARKKFKK